MLTELTEDSLAEIVSDKPKVVVQYMATWCGNCRIMKPKFKKLASENETWNLFWLTPRNFRNPENWLRWIIYPHLPLL